MSKETGPSLINISWHHKSHHTPQSHSIILSRLQLNFSFFAFFLFSFPPKCKSYVEWKRKKALGVGQKGRYGTGIAILVSFYFSSWTASDISSRSEEEKTWKICRTVVPLIPLEQPIWKEKYSPITWRLGSGKWRVLFFAIWKMENVNAKKKQTSGQTSW